MNSRQFDVAGFAKKLFALTLLLSLLALSGPLQGNAQLAPGPAPASPSSPAGGGAPSAVGGVTTLSVESILLAYQASAESATHIANTISNAAPPNATFAIVTNADIGAIVQLKVILAQSSLLTDRLKGVATKLRGNKTFPCFPLTAAQQKAEGKNQGVKQKFALDLSPLLNPASNFQTIVQTLASIAAVNENVAAAPGALSDTSLINLVASKFPAGTTTYVPSSFPPNLLTLDLHPAGSDSNPNSLIGDALSKLEAARANLVGTADTKLLLKDCQAKANQSTVKEIVAEVSALGALVDGFESSLFGGQAAASPTGATNTAAVNNGGGNNNGQGNAPTPSPIPSAGTTLQQILYADLLLKVIPADTYFVSLHSLESGGSSLTKSALFLGSRSYFSGGAWATFSVYQNSGRLVCSGHSTGYRGFVQEKDMGTAALMHWTGTAWANGPIPGDDQTKLVAANDNPATMLPPVAHFTSDCRPYVAKELRK